MAEPGAPLRIALIGDGDSVHLLKWARALAAQPGVELWAASSRGFLPGFDAAVPAVRRLALHTVPRQAGGNVALLRTLPRLARWLRGVDADWLHAHYLTSHGSLAWLARRLGRLRAQIAGSAWGSDILVAPAHSWPLRLLTRRVLRACTLTTSDSQHMAARMQVLGARDVMVFPFGLDALPPLPPAKDAGLFFANRGLEPLYRPERVLQVFAQLAAGWPQARLVVANDGSLAPALQRQAAALGLRVGALAQGAQVEFTGRLSAEAQAGWYARAQWYVSLPSSDSTSVSLLEALAHGCIPLVSDLPANREWVHDGDDGLVLVNGALAERAALDALLARAPQIAAGHRAQIAEQGLFAPAVAQFVARLRALGGT